MIRKAWAGGLFLGLALVLAGQSAQAVIMVLTPLSRVLKEQQYICIAKVDKLYPEKPALVLDVTEDLKGKLPFRRLPVSLIGDTEGKKLGHPPEMLKRVAEGVPIMLFANKFGKRVTVFAYTEGTWFQMTGQQNPDKDDAVVLAFTHCEPYLRRTFKGTTRELRAIVVDGLAGTKAPPEPNANESPGLGPEVGQPKNKDGADRRSPGIPEGPPFAVIPTFGIGAPLAILALLFPSLFGGVLVLFRRWTAFFTVISINSTLFLLHGWFAIYLAPSWWSEPAALWLVMAIFNVLGLMWAWRRHLAWLQQGPGRADAPARTEKLVLGILSVSCLAACLIYVLFGQKIWADPAWGLLLTASVGVWAGAAYRIGRDKWSSADLGATPLPTEGIILWASMCGYIVFAATQTGASGVSSEMTAAEGQAIPRLVEGKPRSVILTQHGNGLVVSALRLSNDRVYVSAGHRQAFQTFGAVYCLDRDLDKVLWSFDDDHGMKQIYSSPWVADGKLFVGEGFHDDVDCKLYCLDAAKGVKLWEFQTTSQVESSPCVAAGKVFFGAGNDGVYCLEAATGKKVWQFPQQQDKSAPLRFGANPVVVGNRVYIGTGVDRNQPENPGETTVCCLDADSGKLVWKQKVDLPCWGAAVVADGRLYVGLGNGDVFDDAKTPGRPAGAILCLSAGDGKIIWRTDVPNGVLERPAVDRQSVYFGCRDGNCYCVNRVDGKERWKKDLGSPVVAGPALDHDSPDGHSGSVVAVAAGGRVASLDPSTGKAQWIYRDLEKAGTHLSSPPRIVVSQEAGGERRRIYFGAALNNLTFPALYCLEDFVPR